MSVPIAPEVVNTHVCIHRMGVIGFRRRDGSIFCLDAQVPGSEVMPHSYIVNPNLFFAERK